MSTPASLTETLTTFNLSIEDIKHIINILEKNETPAVCWQEISRVLVKNNYSFALHLAIFEHIFSHIGMMSLTPLQHGYLMKK